MEPIGMETIGAIIAATVPLIILLWVWVVGRELDRQSNRLREIQSSNAPEPRGYLPEVRHLIYEAGLTELANVSLESGLSD
jgi:hypothetical protein